MNELLKRIRMWATWAVMPKRSGQMIFEGARQTWIASNGHVEVTLIIRQMDKPDVFGRESVYQMLRTVRENERRMAWKCPEPELPPLPTMADVLSGK